MIATLIIFVLLVATAIAVVYRRQQKLLAARAQRELQRPRPPRSLFADTQQALDESARALPEQSTQGYMQQRAAFMARAAADDLAVLKDVQRTNDVALYRVVLNELVERSARADDKLRALASLVMNDGQLRGSVELAEAYSALWQQTPDRTTTGTMLQLAALSDDADTYNKAVEIACLFWQSGQLPQFTGEALRQLIDSQYWLLSADARRTGAGFLLKQRLAGLRAELANTQEAAAPDEEHAVETDG
ncbi:MAG TPA: hypothetical protein VE821_11510 [Pyrinomonadaceae bacterium]|nr:hypothetical protein [Pyrinomonadaceae bacterium]